MAETRVQDAVFALVKKYSELRGNATTEGQGPLKFSNLLPEPPAPFFLSAKEIQEEARVDPGRLEKQCQELVKQDLLRPVMVGQALHYEFIDKTGLDKNLAFDVLKADAKAGWGFVDRDICRRLAERNLNVTIDQASAFCVELVYRGFIKFEGVEWYNPYVDGYTFRVIRDFEVKRSAAQA